MAPRGPQPRPRWPYSLTSDIPAGAHKSARTMAQLLELDDAKFTSWMSSDEVVNTMKFFISGLQQSTGHTWPHSFDTVTYRMASVRRHIDTFEIGVMLCISILRFAWS